MNFVPVIKPDISTSTIRETERAYKRAIKEALGDEAVAKAIAPFKTNGLVKGHKVLDDAEAVRLVEKQAGPRVRDVIQLCGDVNEYRRVQLLNQVLRNEWEMDRQGKLSGNLSPAKLKRLAHKQQRETQQQGDQATAQG